ncbi:alpha/beta hydrolase family protein [Micromonospora rifamycinica]|uniref:Alpha/beta hydrolase family protein n=1 Tax=Micromonospora rifamycinica TaxID=291594 RepID=A0A109II34_9ACTN|nr:hydrolase [Micromonospora rifamycinica]KWV30941.1 hydrolase [Micromonospora rifamycinica]SCG79790.1 Alpha/beta hydrolase family protein [Micromonospora rifamycinica]
MGVRRLCVVLLAASLAGCAPATAATEPPPARHAPDQARPVAVRTLTVDPTGPRPLPVTLWYPTERGRVAPGRFPVVVHSHGLLSLPELHAALATRWAAAGFVVAAPAYPYTSRRATRFSRADVRNQPADAWRLIRHLVRLDARAGDPLAGHLDVGRFAATGHSAGGFTTAGMFTSGHPARLRSGVIIAGGGLAGAFAGPAAPLLFVHGTADPVVPLTVGQAGYRRATGPKAFLGLLGQGHGDYLTPGRPGFDQVLAATTDFLRWTLYDDRDAGRRLRADAAQPGVTTFDDRLAGPGP